MSTENNDCTVIKQAEIAGNYFSKHINFVLQITSGEELRRRYTDFIWVRDWLVNDLPGAYVPAIPPKLPIALWPQGYLAKRKRELQWFLKRCSGIPYVADNKAYQLFLEPNSEVFQKTAKKFDGTRKKGVRKEQYELLTAKFSELVEEELPEDHEKLDAEHLEHTQKLIERYEAMLKNCEALSDSLSQSQDSLNKFLTSRHELGDLQQNEITNSTFLARFLKRKRPDIDKYFEKEGDNHTLWSKCLSRIWEPVIKKNFHDLKCIEEAMLFRDSIKAELTKATATAEKWKTEDTGNKYHIENLKAKQVDQRLNEIENEETLTYLYKFLVKLVDSHRKMVEKMNMDRWSSGAMTLKKHIVPKWTDQKQVWMESLRTFREAISKMEKVDTEARLQKEQERVEASKDMKTKEAALSTEADEDLGSPVADPEEEDLAYPVPEVKEIVEVAEEKVSEKESKEEVVEEEKPAEKVEEKKEETKKEESKKEESKKEEPKKEEPKKEEPEKKPKEEDVDPFADKQDENQDNLFADVKVIADVNVDPLSKQSAEKMDTVDLK